MLISFFFFLVTKEIIGCSISKVFFFHNIGPLHVCYSVTQLFWSAKRKYYVTKYWNPFIMLLQNILVALFGIIKVTPFLLKLWTGHHLDFPFHFSKRSTKRLALQPLHHRLEVVQLFYQNLSAQKCLYNINFWVQTILLLCLMWVLARMSLWFLDWFGMTLSSDRVRRPLILWLYGALMVILTLS